MATTPATWGPANQFLGKVWANERGERLLRPLAPRRSSLQGPATTEIDSPHLRRGRVVSLPLPAGSGPGGFHSPQCV